MFLLDTNACVSFLRGDSQQLSEQLLVHGIDRLAVPTVVVAELQFGARNSHAVATNLRLVERFLEPYRIVPFSLECARVYGRVRTFLKTSGRMIGANDLLIAASAIAHEATLVTHNKREFSRVPELRLVDWQVDEA